MSGTLDIKTMKQIIADNTDKSIQEIDNLIEKKIDELNNMINEEGAINLIAHELGVRINQQSSGRSMKIDDIVPGQSSVTILGRIKRIYQLREFTRKDDTKGKVRNIVIIDDTGEIRVALWDSRADAIDEKEIEIGDIVRISGAMAKQGFNDQTELSVGSQGLIDKISDADEEDFPEVEQAKLIDIESIQEIEDREEVSIKGKITDKQGINEFTRKDGSTGRVTSITVSDTTASTRITFWDNNTEKTEHLEMADIVKITNLSVRTNNQSDRKELTFRPYSKIEKIDDPELENIEVSTGGELEKLSDIKDGMKNVTATGKIIDMGQVNTFERKDGSGTGKVANITISDFSQAIRVSLWGDKTELLEEFDIGDYVQITNAYARRNDFSDEVELSVGDYSSVIDVSDEIDPQQFQQNVEFIKARDIDDARSGVSMKVQLNRIYEPREITRNDGTSSTVLSADAYDEEGQNIRLSAWNDDMPTLEQMRENQGYILHNVRVKPSDGEYPPNVTINRNTSMKETEIDVSEAMYTPASQVGTTPGHPVKRSLDELQEDMQVEVEGTIVNAFKPAFYLSCSKCPKKVIVEEGMEDEGECREHGTVSTRLRMILTLSFDDTTATTQLKLFDQTAEEFLGMTAAEAQKKIQELDDEMAPIAQSDIMMKQVKVTGKVTRDDFNNDDRLQINVNTIESVDLASETDSTLDKFDY